MNKTKLQLVEAKIRELVPRTMEPKFGCHILFGNEVHVLIADKQDGSYIEGVLNGEGEVWGLNTHRGRKANSEILGHPVTLGDVLEAVSEYETEERQFYVDMDGYFFRQQDGHLQMLPWWDSDHVRWIPDLPFENQYRLHDFLYKLFNLSE